MTKRYQIEVDCANCAALAEAAAAKVEGVASVSIHFMMQEMTLTFAEGANERAVLKAVLKACRRVEPDFQIL